MGVDLERDVAGRLAEKRGGTLRLWDSARRAAQGALGPADGTRGMIDALHHAANAARLRDAGAAREILERAGVAREPRFLAALEAVLRVAARLRSLHRDRDLEGAAAAAGDDFEALYGLYRLAFRNEIDEPEQLKFWRDDD